LENGALTLNIKTTISQNLDSYVQNLKSFLAIPSISADQKFKTDVAKCSEQVKKMLLEIGIPKVAIHQTKGHPIVFGELVISDNLPTTLVYGHYDVQPPDPIELWESGPFEPVIKKTAIHPEGAIFARGAADDKGQIFAQMKAIELAIKNNSLKTNLKIIYEGEEEIGSEHLEDFCIEHKEMLKCDQILVSDTSILSNSQPTLNTGLRGLSYLEVEVTGPNKDLHSGVYGGTVANPAVILTKILAKMFDENNKITIPEFYDDVQKISEQEMEVFSKLPFDQEKYCQDLEVNSLFGEQEFHPLARCSIRPSLDVNGIISGYTGEGAKTVLPSKASCKISARLVPNQDPNKISKVIEKFIIKNCPDSVKVKVKPHHGGYPYVWPITDPSYVKAEQAMAKAYGINPLPLRGGGSIPILPMFEKTLNAKSILLGFGLDSDQIHSPNEHFGLGNLKKAIEAIYYFITD